MWSFVTSRGQRVSLPTLPALVGRDRATAEVALPHPSVHPMHARVLAHAGGLRIVSIDDALLTVNGRTVRDASLSHGDDVVLGALLLRIEDDTRGEVEPPGRTSSAATGGPASSRGAPAATGASGPSRVSASAGDGPSPADDLTVRGARPSPAASSGGRARGAQELSLRARGPLRSARPAAKDGLLHVDLGQLHPVARLGVVCALLAVAALVAWAVSAGIAALP